MNKDEVIKVLRILAMADGGCDYCAARLYQEFVNEFPEHYGVAKAMFFHIFYDDFEEVLDDSS